MILSVVAMTQADQLPSFMLGQYNYVDGENHDNFLKAIGVSGFLRGLVGTLTPTQYISEDQNGIRIYTSLGIKSIESVFKLNTPYMESGFGQSVPTTAVLEGNKLIKYKEIRGLKVVEERVFTRGGTRMTLNLRIEGQPQNSAVRRFKKA